MNKKIMVEILISFFMIMSLPSISAFKFNITQEAIESPIQRLLQKIVTRDTNKDEVTEKTELILKNKKYIQNRVVDLKLLISFLSFSLACFYYYTGNPNMAEFFLFISILFTLLWIG